MCGFTGYLYLDSRKETDNANILQMLALQKHRGPDDSGIVIINREHKIIEEISAIENVKFSNSADLVFGFNRLSILDLSPNGHQPMISADGNVILMMNGEIYNAFNFRDDLIKKGYAFKSKTDTEVVLNLYIEYGMEGMLNRLNGMFALVIYDLRLNNLFLARDRFGIKPLYILQESGRIAFSSELKSFKALPKFIFDLDESKLDEYLLFRNVINSTLFKNIKNCTPGTFFSVALSGDVNETVFYNIDQEGYSQYCVDESYFKLEESLQNSVERQMMSDVKLGCQLSGGVDSSLVTYYAAQTLQKGNLETISITFDNPHFSEEQYIDHVRKVVDLASHKYILSPDYYFNEIENATWHFEQPLNHPNTIGIYLLSQKAKNHVTVLLSGEGADESLAGYPRFINTMRPYAIKHLLSNLKQNYKNIGELLSYFKTVEGRIIMSSAFGNISSIKKLKKDFSFKNATSYRNSLLSDLHGNNLLRHRKYELLTYLPDLLMRQDKMSMAHSIENRVPFLDNEMIKTSLNIPDNLLIDKRNGKRDTKLLLKKICSKKFDSNFAFRNKMGFGIPLGEFMRSKSFLQKWKCQIEPGIKRRRIFNIENSYRNIDIYNANSEVLESLWIITSFELWAQQFLD